MSEQPSTPDLAQQFDSLLAEINKLPPEIGELFVPIQLFKTKAVEIASGSPEAREYTLLNNLVGLVNEAVALVQTTLWGLEQAQLPLATLPEVSFYDFLSAITEHGQTEDVQETEQIIVLNRMLEHIGRLLAYHRGELSPLLPLDKVAAYVVDHDGFNHMLLQIQGFRVHISRTAKDKMQLKIARAQAEEDSILKRLKFSSVVYLPVLYANYISFLLALQLNIPVTEEDFLATLPFGHQVSFDPATADFTNPYPEAYIALRTIIFNSIQYITAHADLPGKVEVAIFANQKSVDFEKMFNPSPEAGYTYAKGVMTTDPIGFLPLTIYVVRNSIRAEDVKAFQDRFESYITSENIAEGDQKGLKLAADMARIDFDIIGGRRVAGVCLRMIPSTVAGMVDMEIVEALTVEVAMAALNPPVPEDED